MSLEFRNVTLAGPDGSRKPAIRELSLMLGRGRTVALVPDGPALPAALAAVLTGRGRILSGEIRLDGELKGVARRGADRLGRLPLSVLRAVGRLPVNPAGSIGAAILEPLRLAPGKLSPAETGERLAKALTNAGLDEAAEGMTQALVDLVPGQGLATLAPRIRMQIALARALITEPAFILALDPFEGLDPMDRAWLANRMLELAKAEQIALLVTTNSIHQAAQIGQETGIALDGQLVEFGVSEKICAQPRHDYTRLLLNTEPDPSGGSYLHRRAPGPLPGIGETFLDRPASLADRVQRSQS